MRDSRLRLAVQRSWRRSRARALSRITSSAGPCRP
jgi:hypothetical protein